MKFLKLAKLFGTRRVYSRQTLPPEVCSRCRAKGGPNLYATEDFILITPLYENSFAPCFKRHTSATKRIKIMPAYCNNLAPFRDSKTRRYLILKRSPTIRVNAMQNHSQSAFDLDKRSWIIFKDL